MSVRILTVLPISRPLSCPSLVRIPLILKLLPILGWEGVCVLLLLESSVPPFSVIQDVKN